MNNRDGSDSNRGNANRGRSDANPGRLGMHDEYPGWSGFYREFHPDDAALLVSLFYDQAARLGTCNGEPCFELPNGSVVPTNSCDARDWLRSQCASAFDALPSENALRDAIAILTNRALYGDPGVDQ